MKYKNNPANIRYVSSNLWKGLEGSVNGFCEFSSIEYGLRALMVLLKNYIKKYHLSNVSQILHRFAPPTENNTRAYISFVSIVLLRHDCETTNIKPFSLAFYWLTVAICYYETKSSYAINELIRIAKKFGLWSDCIASVNKQLVINFKNDDYEQESLEDID